MIKNLLQVIKPQQIQRFTYISIPQFNKSPTIWIKRCQERTDLWHNHRQRSYSDLWSSLPLAQAETEAVHIDNLSFGTSILYHILRGELTIFSYKLKKEYDTVHSVLVDINIMLEIYSISRKYWNILLI